MKTRVKMKNRSRRYDINGNRQDIVANILNISQDDDGYVK